MTTFLVETHLPDPDGTQRFIYAAQEMGHKTILSSDGNADELPKDGPIVFFGSLNMIRRLQEKDLPNKPIIWCDWDKFSCHHYYAHYGKYLIQKEYGFYPFGELPRLQNFLYKTYGCKNRIFVRPDTNDKVFTGEVVGEPQFDYWYKLAQIYEPKPTLLCVVSKPALIHMEYRFIVCEGKVITGSQYKVGGMIQSIDPYSQKVANFAEEIASVWSPHPIFVIDIAISREDGKMYLMEVGPVNGAGLYKCDARPIVRAMSYIAEK